MQNAENYKDEYILRMEDVTQIYSNGFVANKNVNFLVKRGEIHGLVGENGAGKTTLMKILFGLEKPTTGRIILNDKEVEIHNPLAALSFGIGMVHQHFMLVDSLTVAENLVLGMEPKKGLLYDKQKAIDETRQIAEKFNLPVNPLARVADISVGMKQRIEILKILYRGAKLLLLDEPTAVLTPQETEELFKRLVELKHNGFTIVFISHKLNEIKDICDSLTVLRKGRIIGRVDTSSVTESEISSMMVGRDVSLELDKAKAEPSDVILKVRNLDFNDTNMKPLLNNVSFDLRRGEILGVAGVEGNGQSELAEILSGLLPVQKGEASIKGQPINKLSIHEIRSLGTSLVHEDRMVYGAASSMSIAENILSDRYDQPAFSTKGRLLSKSITDSSLALIDEYQVACSGPNAMISTLSGGNIQKVVSAREFSSKPELLIVSQPTRGIDVGAAEIVRKKIIELRDSYKTGILLFSADLTELLSVSDSIIVLHNGEIVAYFKALDDVSETVLGEYMLGLKKQHEEEIGGVVYERIS